MALPVAGRLPERGVLDAVSLKEAEAPNPKSEMWENEKGAASGKSGKRMFEEKGCAQL